MYPNVAGFGNQQFLQLGDPDLMLACVEAYNDWQTDWASADSRRLIDKVGVDRIMFETDFPHPTSLYGGDVHTAIANGLGDSDEETRHKILWANGQKLYKVEEPTPADEEKVAALSS